MAKRQNILTIILLILLLFIPGCSDQFSKEVTQPDKSTYLSKSDFLLNTLVTIQLYDKQEERIINGCFALGLEKGLELIDSLPNTYAVFITKDYELYYSEGFEDNITIILQ